MYCNNEVYILKTIPVMGTKSVEIKTNIAFLPFDSMRTENSLFVF